MTNRDDAKSRPFVLALFASFVVKSSGGFTPARDRAQARANRRACGAEK